MTNFIWGNTGSGNWSNAGLWFNNNGFVPGSGDDVLFNPGSFDAVINDGETFAIRSLTQNGSSTRLGGVISITDFSAVGVGGVIYGGSTSNGTTGDGKITGSGSLVNQGLIEADVAGGVLQIDSGSFTNQGVVSASGGAILFLTSGNFTNLAGGVLTGGTYEVNGNGTAMDFVGGFDGVSNFFDARVFVDNATITLNGPGSYLFGYNPAISSYDTLEATLASIDTGGVLNILGGRDYTTANTLTNAGVLALGGGTLDAAVIWNQGGAVIVGYGTILPAIGNLGVMEAQLGTLVLAGGITDSGALQVDAKATLAFSGVYSQSILNNGTIEVPAGSLRLSGAISGGGGYFIEGGTPGAVTTLDLSTAASGNVAFNGANGMLVLGAPGSFTGSIIGFGAGDTIDLAGVVSNGATLAGSTLNITNAGTTVYSLALQGDYSAASFSGASDGAGGTKITLSGVAPRDFALEGASWADRTITWSLASFQYAADADPTPTPQEGSRNVPFSHFIDPGAQSSFVAVIQQALDTWATIGGFNFVQQADSSDPGQAADLRFGWGSLLGTGGEIGQASFNFFGTIFQSDVVIRLQDPAITPLVANAGVIGGFAYQGLASTFYQIVVHEIGHALGLGHSSDSAAVMYPSAQGVLNQSPNASDIAGIHAIYDSIACFAAGTRILTARGAIAVERLLPGDRVATLLSGRLRPVRWIGHRSVAPLRHARPEDVTPVRVAAGAFGPGRPLRDLLLSPDHAVFIEDVLVPIRHLVNGATIRPAAMDRVTYFHVELAGEDGSPAHDVLLADGLPAESFLDTGNRDAFADAPAPALHPDFARRAWDAASCAPLHQGGAVVEAVHARLLGIAASLGHARTDDPGLHAVVAGRVIHPRRIEDGWRFDLPAGEVVLRSRAEVPGAFCPASTERRRLGVAVRGLRHDGVAIALDDARLLAGFHPVERTGAASWRWTDGAGMLVLDTPGRLEVMAGPALAYWVEDASPIHPALRHPLCGTATAR